MTIAAQVYADAPTAPTGFGTVTRNIFMPLVEQEFFSELRFWGVNYHGEPHGLPVPIWPARQHGDPDPYGRGRFAHTMLANNEANMDLFYLLQDHFTLAGAVTFPDGRTEGFAEGLVKRMREQVAQGKRKPFKTVIYVPVDSSPLRPEWAAWLPGTADHIVAYTEFGKREIIDCAPAAADKISVIYHGTSPETFFPIENEQRDRWRMKFLKARPEDPVIVSVNRNQPRKDVPRTLQIFRQVLDKYPRAVLYLHMNPQDSAGFYLPPIAHDLRIPTDRIVYPNGFNEGRGVSVEELNVMYNLGDLFLTTCRGEGWGLTVTEAMCAGTPVVAPCHTSLEEICSGGRGILVSCDKHPSVMVNDNEQLRPSIDVDAATDACLTLIQTPSLRASVGQAALDWSRSISWSESIVPQWNSLFEEVCRGARGDQG